MILALDASISSTGYAVMSNSRNIVECDKITTKLKDGESNRIFKIASKVKSMIEQHGINKVILEDQFLRKNVKTAMQLSRLRGAIMFVCSLCNVELILLMPSEIRKELMGNGSASKEDVAHYIIDFYKDEEKVKSLGEFNDRQCKAKNSDIYDAISIALAYVNTSEEV